MTRDEYTSAIDQLSGAADLVAADALGAQRMEAFQMRAFFRLQQLRIKESGVRETKDDALFLQTAMAALMMAGRKEFAASSALLDQARALLTE